MGNLCKSETVALLISSFLRFVKAGYKDASYVSLVHFFAFAFEKIREEKKEKGEGGLKFGRGFLILFTSI
jgi:hypothetical protein